MKPLRAAAALVIAVITLAVAGMTAQQEPSVPKRPDTAKAVLRTPWGDPDISGLFTTDDELGVPFERPAQFGERAFVTAEEFAQRQTQTERQDEADREAFVAPRPQQAGGPVAGVRVRPRTDRARPAVPAHVARDRSARRPHSVPERRGAARCDCRDADAGRHQLRRT